jgi:hypothetical protein
MMIQPAPHLLVYTAVMIVLSTGVKFLNKPLGARGTPGEKI